MGREGQAARRGTSAADQDRPTILLVGSGEAMAPGIRLACDRHGLFVEVCNTDALPGAVHAAAPDLVVLTGDAAEDGGTAVLRILAANPATAVAPVAVLSNEPGLDDRLRAFRYGAVAVIQRGSSVDAIGCRVAELAKELPERRGEASGNLGEATLEELAELVKDEIRSGILSVEHGGEGEEAGSLRIVLGAGRPVADALKDFVERLRPLVGRAEPVRYAFHEEPGGRLQLLDPDGAEEGGDVLLLHGLRVLVVDEDAGRADMLAQELRARGSTVVVIDVEGVGLDRARELDPEVVILDAAGLEGKGFELVRSFRRDPRLRWASLLVANWDEMAPDREHPPAMEPLAARIAPLLEQDRQLRARAIKEPRFDTRLEATGPSRLLRSLAWSKQTLHVTVRNPKALLEIDLAEGLIVGATGLRKGGDRLEGLDVLTALLAISSGRVHVERRDHPSVANVMTPVDESIGRAVAEVPPIEPSTPPPSLRPEEGDEPTRVDVPRAAEAPHFPSAEALRKIPGAGGPRALTAPSKLGGLGERSAWDTAKTPHAGVRRKGTMLGMPPVGVVGSTPPAAPDSEGRPTPVQEMEVPGGARPPLGLFAPISPAVRIEEVAADAGRTAAGRRSPARAFKDSEAPTLPPRPDSRQYDGGEEEPTASRAARTALLAQATQPGGLADALDEHAAIETGESGEEATAVSEPPLGALLDEDVTDLALSHPPGTVPIDVAAIAAVAAPPAAVPAPPAAVPAPPAAVPPSRTDATEISAPPSMREWPEGSPPAPRRKGRGLLITLVLLLLVLVGGVAALWVLRPELVEQGLALVGLSGGASAVEVAEGAGGEATEGAGEEVAEGAGEEATEGAGEEVAEGAGEEVAEGAGEEVAEGVGEGGNEEVAEGAGEEGGQEVAEGTGEEAGQEGGEEAPADALAGRSAQSLISEAESLARQGQIQEATPLFERAYELRPEDNHALAGMALVWIARGDGARAVEMAEGAVRARARRASYRLILGDAHRLAGNLEEAQAAYRRALALEPGDPQARQRLSELAD